MKVRALPRRPSNVMVSTAIKTPCCICSLSVLDCSFSLLNSLLVVLDGADNLEKSEVQAIIESTPELDMDLDGCRGTR